MKILFVVVLATAATAAAENFCTPGSYFKKDCNTCSCSKDGKSAACTDMLCPEEMENYPSIKNERFCEPGKKFKLDDLTTCVCKADGTVAECTLGVVPKFCTPGKIFSPDNCNVCKCSASGYKAICSLALCVKENTLDVKNSLIRSTTAHVCEPLSQFKDYCNHCSCSNDGQSLACTRMMCDHNVWNKDGSLKTDSVSKNTKQVCTARSRFNNYCNTCFCNNDGTDFACTRMQCDRNIWNKDGSMKPIATTYNQKAVCEAGTRFNDYCNTCTCNDDGNGFACTRMYCDKSIWNKDGSMKLPATSYKQNKICDAGSQFHDYCNTCFCNNDGTDFACTRMQCDKNIWNKDGSMRFPATPYNQKKICEAGSRFNDYCNTCFCNNEGTDFACTRMQCDKNIWNKDGSMRLPATPYNQKKICEAGSRFNDYCNTCFCNNDGTDFACTRMQCDENIWNKDGSMRLPATPYNQKKICEAGSRFNDYCNTCFCNNDGTDFACTRMQCDENIWNKDGSMRLPATPYNQKKICESGSRFNDYCNTCFCNNDGTDFACTRMLCDKNIWNKDGSMRLSATTHNQKNVCEAGSRFNDYCNTCVCNKDGTGFACTRMLCDKDIWNMDGSLKSRTTEQQVCEPNTHFKEYCNTCSCSADGTNKICTFTECDLNVWNKDGSRKVAANNNSTSHKVCVPGKAYSPDDCNTCVCNEYGTQLACTSKLCMTTLKQAYEVDEAREWGPLYRQGDACAPGKSFYSECNRCVCTATGKSAFCTLASCSAHA